MKSPVVVLDLDGVILRSNSVKRHAMLSLFAEHPSQEPAIASYVAANPGVRRDHKIRHILQQILKVHLGEQVVANYLAQYEQQLAGELSAAPLVAGVQAFLAGGEHPFYVSSSAPESEVVAQLGRRALAQHFVAVFGAATAKADALRRVCERHAHSAIVFFGDSVGDCEAAREAGVAFVGVISEGDTFGHLPIVKLVDFAYPDAIRASMESALK